MRTTIIPDIDFQDRVKRLQLELAAADLDVLITYSSESEAASCYLADFFLALRFRWGDRAGAEGVPALVTGGPESYEFAKQFSRIKDIHIHPLFVESSAPDGCRPSPTVPAANPNRSAAGSRSESASPTGTSSRIPSSPTSRMPAGAEIMPADEVLLRTKCIKSGYEIAAYRQAYWITEQAMIEALDGVAEGMAEWEIEAGAHMTMRRLGAEGTSYPIWVCSGPNTHQSLCRSTNRRIRATSWCSSPSARWTWGIAATCAGRSPLAGCPTAPAT